MDEWEKVSGPFRELTAEWKELAERLPYVDAFWIDGSRVAGRQTPTSDIDYTFLVKRKEDERRLRRQLMRSLSVDPVPGWYPEETWALLRWKERPRKDGVGEFVSPHVSTTRQALYVARNLFNMRPVPFRNVRWRAPTQTTYFLLHQEFGRTLLEETAAVYDSRGLVPRMRKMVSAYPDRLSKQIVEDFVRRLRGKLLWFTPWVQKGKATFILAVQDILYYIATAHYAKNKRFMGTLGLTRYHYDLPTLKPDLRRELDRLLAIDRNFWREDKSVYLKGIVKKLSQ